MEENTNKNKVIVIPIAKIFIIIAIIAVIAIIVGITLNIRNAKDDAIIFENEFKNIKTKDANIIYHENIDQTTINFIIENNTNEDINKQTINVMLIDKNNVPIASIYSHIEFIKAKGEFLLDATVSGNLLNTAKIRLQKTETLEEQESP